MKSLLILGRQPALGLAELESLYGADALTPLRSGAALLEVEPAEVAFDRLGGSIKLAKVLTVLDTTTWRDIEDYLIKTIPDHLQYVPEGKFRLGLSSYGLRARPADINVTGLRLKKVIRAEGRGVRIVQSKNTALNSAQVLHNQLTSPTGWELVLVRHDNQTILAQTVAEQDIEAYAARDQNRPMRDAKVGMLPPKLAQIIINLAYADGHSSLLLDPFCGTGVLLQEAMLMGLEVCGTDIDPRMVDFTRRNLDWLANNFAEAQHPNLFTILLPADATTYKWQDGGSTLSYANPNGYMESHFEFDEAIIACETYLGKPLSSLPSRDVLEKIMSECDEIHDKFLRNIGAQIKPGAHLCLAVPAWKTKTGFLHLKTLAKLEQLGYTRKKFVHARDEELIYHRPDQIVARELVVLEKK